MPMSVMPFDTLSGAPGSPFSRSIKPLRRTAGSGRNASSSLSTSRARVAERQDENRHQKLRQTNDRDHPPGAEILHGCTNRVMRMLPEAFCPRTRGLRDLSAMSRMLKTSAQKPGGPQSLFDYGLDCVSGFGFCQGYRRLDGPILFGLRSHILAAIERCGETP